LTDLSEAYTEVSQRLSVVLVALEEDESDTPVAACPGWTVRDVVAHHCGAVVDAVSGNIAELKGFNLLDQWRDQKVADARDALTGREVAERAGRSLRSLVEEWSEATAALVPIMRGERPFPEPVPSILTGVLINDVVVHEGDIRSALALEPVQHGAAMSLAITGYGFSLDYRIRLLGLAPLILECDDRRRSFGGGVDPGATLRASRYELVRCLASRRTANDIRNYDWTGNPEPYISILPEYGPTATSTG
jgi:uncharacterized protein (TIGR03083 family)